jgi:hypothetical protein
MTKDEALDKALDMALEALEKATRYGAGGFEDVKDAIKQARSAPVQEPVAKDNSNYRYDPPVAKPVAWGMPGKDGFIFDVICPEEHTREEGGYTVPLYTTPPAAQRQWVGLTDADIRPLCSQSWVVDTVKQWAVIIEAKLKEKNIV